VHLSEEKNNSGAGGAAIAAVAGRPVIAGALVGAGAGTVVGAVTH
jgi:hypothetical protein